MNDRIIIAIDGYSSSGKSTMARELADRIGYTYVDSGAMYRAVTLYALRHGMRRPDGTLDEAALSAALPDIHVSFAPPVAGHPAHTLLNGEDVEKEIRGLEVSGFVSPVAAVPAVRHRLVAMQQEFGRNRGIVMDGRDIGTTVFPDAELKVFVQASAAERARRRHKELAGKGVTADYDEVLRNIEERDRIDISRAESPLRQAADAVVLDNDNHTPESQMEWLLGEYNRVTAHAAHRD